MKLLFSLTMMLLVTLPSIAQPKPPQPDSAHRLIDTALSFAKKHSLYRNKVDWQKIEDTIRRTAASATTPLEAVPAIRLLFQLLGDHHATLFYKGRSYRWQAARTPIDTTLHENLLKKYKQDNTVETRFLEKGTGYLLIPDNNPTHAGDDDRIAQQIQDSLQSLHPETLKGLVIDLRVNPGGDMYAMLAGIANLFSPGRLGSFFDPAAGTHEDWGLTRSVAWSDKDTICRLTRVGPSLSHLKIVVLISPETASSGEATAISFKGRPNTWFVGENTAGYTTANGSFWLSGNLGLFMATSIESDRNNNIYWEDVSPDELIIGGDNFDDLTKDKKIGAALRWLKK